MLQKSLLRFLEPLVRELFDQFLEEILPKLVEEVKDLIDQIDGQEAEGDAQ